MTRGEFLQEYNSSPATYIRLYADGWGDGRYYNVDHTCPETGEIFMIENFFWWEATDNMMRLGEEHAPFDFGASLCERGSMFRKVT